MSHTPEPWHWERESNGSYTVNTKAQSTVSYRQPEGIRVAYIAPDASAGAASIEAANARRIVACVNGCAGLNPAAYRSVVEALKQYGQCNCPSLNVHPTAKCGMCQALAHAEQTT